jgi:hypothetical protein
MTTWKQCSDYHIRVFDAIQAYTLSNFKNIKDDTVEKNISIHLLEKFHINLLNCIELLPRVEKAPLNFLSIGLIIRGMLSDVIQHRYLTMIHDKIGNVDFENEIKVLDLDFIKNYKSMVENEKKMAKADADKVEEIEKVFKTNFAEYYKGNDLKTMKDFQAENFKETLKKYAEENEIKFPDRLYTEAAKMQLVKDQHTEKIDLLYSYLSVLQHFSGRAYNFYKNEDYLTFNPHLTLMNLFFVTLSVIQIVKVLDGDAKYLGMFFGLAKEIAEL